MSEICTGSAEFLSKEIGQNRANTASFVVLNGGIEGGASDPIAGARIGDSGTVAARSEMSAVVTGKHRCAGTGEGEDAVAEQLCCVHAKLHFTACRDGFYVT